MANPSAEAVWNIGEKELAHLLQKGIFTPDSKKVTFYAPSFMHYKTSTQTSPSNRFPTFSVTGKTCTLNCGHCKGKLLATMEPTDTPEKLFKAAKTLKKKGGLGCLVSGGCLPNGSVPLNKFLPTMEKIKDELDLTVIVHTGIINEPTAIALKNSGIDAALIDIVGDNKTIEEICHLKLTARDYENSLKALHTAGLNFVPHVIVGLQNGKLLGELKALKMIAKVKPSALVIIAFMPVRGTLMENVEPPSPIDIARTIVTARQMLPETPLALGCMRPKGKHREETDCLSLDAGVDAIAFPSEKAIHYAQEHGYQTRFSPYCCSQIFTDASARSLSK